MKVRNALAAAVASFACAHASASVERVMASRSFEQLATACAPNVHPTTLRGLVSVESSGNPFAIGVVDGQLERQPRDLDEAVATARELERQGYNFSMGLGQVNRYNLTKYGATYETVFEPCRNLQVGAAILQDCYDRASSSMRDPQQAVRAALSCYYSGNFTRGFKPDKAGQPSYVQKVIASATDAKPIRVVPALERTHSDGVIPQATTPASKPEPPAWVIYANQPANVPTEPAQASAPPEPQERSEEKLPPVRVQFKATTDTQGQSSSSPEPAFVQFVN